MLNLQRMFALVRGFLYLRLFEDKRSILFVEKLFLQHRCKIFIEMQKYFACLFKECTHFR